MGKNAAIKITFGLEDQYEEPAGESILDRVGYAGLHSLINIGIVEATQFFQRLAQQRREQEHYRQMEREAERLRQQQTPFSMGFQAAALFPHKFEVRGSFLVAHCQDDKQVKVAVADVDEQGVPAWNVLEGGGYLLTIARGIGVPVPNPPAAVPSAPPAGTAGPAPAQP